jgi:hypothetical protein
LTRSPRPVRIAGRWRLRFLIADDDAISRKLLDASSSRTATR